MDPTVLIVEDEAAIVTMLRYNLEREGMNVVEAGDGDEALKIMAETHVDLVLLDWMLPVMSGIEVCRQIRRKPESRDLPVIMVTARGEEGDRIRGLDTGADDYVTKPFAIGELLARIRALLRRSGPAQPQGQLIYSDIEMDLAAHRVNRSGKAIHLGRSFVCCGTSWNIRAGFFRANNCLTPFGGRISMSKPVRLMCIFAACARR